MKTRYKMKCKDCNKIFYCSGQCKKDFRFDVNEGIGECLCWNCDVAHNDWKMKCGKELKEFNPSSREGNTNEKEMRKV